MKKNFVFLIILLASFPLFASDLAREKRLAAEIEDSILDGDVVYLTVKQPNLSEFKFLNIYTESETDVNKGAVILMHGRGYHPNWEDVVHPLRVGLTEHGWATLSMQMPVLEKQAKYYDYVPLFHESFPRIDAGITFLKKEGFNHIVLIAHSCSVHMAMAWFKQSQFDNISAFVGIGMGATDYQQPMAAPFPLASIKVPVLDIYGQDEYPAVIHGATNRLKQIKLAGNSESRQMVVPKADHYFHNKGDVLTTAVNQWLETLNLD